MAAALSKLIFNIIVHPLARSGVPDRGTMIIGWQLRFEVPDFKIISARSCRRRPSLPADAAFFSA